mgnify:CR=1 FL=1
METGRNKNFMEIDFWINGHEVSKQVPRVDPKSIPRPSGAMIPLRRFVRDKLTHNARLALKAATPQR